MSLEKKLDLYGKCDFLLERAYEKRENNPIIITSTHKPSVKEGLGCVDISTSILPSSTQIQVTMPGFNWVKGTVLQPTLKSKLDRYLVDPMEKVKLAVLAINKKIDIIDRVEKAKTKAIEINSRLEEITILNRVEKAKTKANEINSRFNNKEISKIELPEKQFEWKKVKISNKKKIKKSKKSVDVENVIRVPIACAELALLHAIQSGLKNVRIIYT